MSADPRGRDWIRAPTTPAAAIALTTAFMVAVLAVSALFAWQQYRTTLAEAEARAMSSAHVVAAHVQWLMEASDQALRRIDEALGSSPASNTEQSIQDISKAVADLPSGFQYSVYSSSGRLRLSSVPGAAGIDVSDRQYFQALQKGPQTVVSPQLKERLSGEQVFVVARRISRNGEFVGAASIAIPTGALEEFWHSLNLGVHSTISIIREDGWLVARRPQVEKAMNLSQVPLFKDLLPKAPSGVYDSGASPADGVARIVGYWKVPGWPLVAVAGVERGEALAPFFSNVRRGLLIGMPVLLALALSSFGVARLLRAEATRRQELELALGRNQVLLREIHHRVKNNLQTVAALLGMHPLPQQVRQDITRRISAMAAVHEQIYGADRFDRVAVAPYAERLIADIAAAYQNRDVRIETHIDPISVSSERALPLGLVLNELVSNAFKHAFAPGKPGRLSIGLKRLADRISLTVKDDGAGFSPNPDHNGLGNRLVQAFVSQLGGSVTVENDGGTRATVVFPYDEGTDPASL